MKTYIVKQEEENDCGACSLLSIIKYYKGMVPLEIIKIDTLTNKNGTTFYNLKMAAQKYGFEVNGKKNIKISKTIICPFIAQVKIDNILEHFIVVYKIDSNILCMDPGIGLVKYSSKEFSKIFTGNILELTPINKIVKYDKTNPFLLLVKEIAKKYSKLLICLLIISMLTVAISLINTLNINLLINNTSSKIIILVLFLLLIRLIITYTKNILISHLNKKISIELLGHYLVHIFNLPLKYLQLKKTGDIVSKIYDLNNIKEIFTKTIINTFIYLILVLGSLIIMIYMKPTITILIVFLTLIYSVIIYFVYRDVYYKLIYTMEQENILFSDITEYITKIVDIKILNLNNFFISKLVNKLKVNLNLQYILETKINIIDLIITFFNESSYILIILGYTLNYFDLTNVFIYIYVFNYYNEAVKYLLSTIPEYMHFKAIFNKISSLYYLAEEDANTGVNFINGDINIHNLSYNIGNNKIINNLCINIKKHSKILVIGNNGCGKTTLLNILYKNINDYDGNIFIAGLNLNEIQLQTLKNKVGYITQDSNIFNDTILNNIILDADFDSTKFDKISKMVYLDEIIKNKKNRYNTLALNNLSGGEMQRIILARLLYKDYEILLLDEALSEISVNIRNKIISNINNYYKNKTIIYVSHNFERYHYDKIINLTARKDKNVNG